MCSKRKAGKTGEELLPLIPFVIKSELSLLATWQANYLSGEILRQGIWFYSESPKTKNMADYYIKIVILMKSGCICFIKQRGGN